MSEFSFLQLSQNILNRRHTGLRSFYGDVGESGNITVPVQAKLPVRARAEVFAYFMNMPVPDYHVWQRMYMKIRDAILHLDVTREVRFFDLYTNLKFASVDTVENNIKALFEVIRKYILAAHEVVAWTVLALVWFNLERHPISARAKSAFRSANLRNILTLLTDMPVSRPWVDYLINVSRMCVAYPEDGAVIMGMPLFKLPSQLHMEGIKPSATAAAYHKDDIPTHHDKGMYEAIPELIGAGLYTGDGTPTVAEYADEFNQDYGGVIGYIYDNLVASASNLLTNIGYASNEAFAVESELLAIMNDMGILDAKFDWTEIQKQVNARGVFSFVDFIEKCKMFADRPRPVLRHSRHPWIRTAAATPESTPWYPQLGDYIDDATNGDVIEDHDFYEYMYEDPADAGFAAIAGSGEWNVAGVTISPIDDADPIAEDQGSKGAYGIHVAKMLKELWSPYKDWYLPTENYLEEQLSAEKGMIFAVLDEYNKGYYVPRYAIVPAHDPTDPFDCGVFFVLSKEMFGKWETGSWGAYAEVYESPLQVSAFGATKNVWESGYSQAGLQDMLMFVGSSLFMKPMVGFGHPFASQCSWWDRTADDQPPEGNASIATKLNADYTLGAIPFVPFIYAVGYPSIEITSGSANGDNDWNETYGFWEGTGAATDKYDHGTATDPADRRGAWYVMERYDPIRPHLYRFSNLHLAFTKRYADIIHGAFMDWSSIFTTEVIEKAEITREARRFISSFAIGKDFETPIRSTAAVQTSRSRPPNVKPSSRTKESPKKTVQRRRKSRGPSAEQFQSDLVDIASVIPELMVQLAKSYGQATVGRASKAIQDLVRGKFPDRVPTGPGVLNDMMNDPEIRAILERFKHSSSGE